MLVNEGKHQGLVLGEMDFSFSFPVQETLEIFGMEIDKKLNSFSHISGPPVMIYVAITFCPFVSLEQRALALVLSSFSYFSAKQYRV